MTEELDTPEPTETLSRAGRPSTARHKSPIREESIAEPTREASTRGEKRLRRTKKKSNDAFHLEQCDIPPGQSYQWVRASCYGKPDHENMSNMKENHWVPVPKDRHAGLITEKDGMVLMERPSYLTLEAQREDYEMVMGEVSAVSKGMIATPQGTFTREHPSLQNVNRLEHTRRPIAVDRSTGELHVPVD